MSEQEFLSGFCPKCGESLKVPAKLSQFSCMYCGARLTADELLDKPAGLRFDRTGGCAAAAGCGQEAAARLRAELPGLSEENYEGRI